MYEYKLEAHLGTLCAQYPRYINLNSTWTLNKRTCSDLLKSVVIRYPHFSMHDASHAEAVVSKMEMLLGSRIQKLSPTDTWLLLHAAYAHDLGMVVQWSEIKDVWEQPEFQSYLSSLSISTDPDLRAAAKFIQDTSGLASSQVWPLEAYRYVSLINANYFRTQHAQLSKAYINSAVQKFDLDLGHNGLIQPRLIKLLGQICAIHTESTEKALDLDYQTNGFDSDYAHPRFVAMLLRLGDLLDIDNGRFNTGAELSFGGLPATSIPHKEKHESTTQLLVTPAEISFRSDCPNSEAYLEVRQFVTWLESEVDFFTKYWSKIAPEDLGGYAPCFDRKELLINGVQDIDGVAGLKFEISQDKAFQIIEGSNIYEDRFVFIREVIQNALDASKLQLWNDLTSGTYRAWFDLPITSALQPYNLNKKIYESYPVQVKLSTLPDGLVQVEITDRGTGISVDSFKRMCSVGTSNSGSKQIQKMIQDMPNWLRPTAGFGIGLQSIFLLTDQFEVDTSTGTETFHAVVHSKRTGGYLQLQRAEKSLPRGTTIRIQFKMPENFQFSFGGETDQYLEFHLDPISPEDYTGEVRVLESIRINCQDSMFPIHVACEKAPVPPMDVKSQLPIANSEWEKWKDRYRYTMSKDADRLQLWDTQSATYGEFQFVGQGYRGSRVRFKGMEVNKGTPHLLKDGISVTLDVYGLDTKETITLDRSALTRDGKRKISNLFHEFVTAFIEITLNHLENETATSDAAYQVRGKFDPYVFWRVCNHKQRLRIPKAVLNAINDTATVIFRDGEQKEFKKREIPVQRLISTLDKQYFINLDAFNSHTGPNSIQYQKMCQILDLAEGCSIEQIIADPILNDEIKHGLLHTLQIPAPGEPLLLYTLSAEDNVLLDAQGHAKAAILKGLSGPIEGMSYTRSYDKNHRAKRYAIPALSAYSALAVDYTPYGIAEPSGICTYLILAPFVREEAHMMPEQPKERFIELVTSSETFPYVVEYVNQHSINKASKEQIIADYRRLIGDYYDALLKTPSSYDENS